MHSRVVRFLIRGASLTFDGIEIRMSGNAPGRIWRDLQCEDLRRSSSSTVARCEIHDNAGSRT